jgi:outer membrane protein assembly factor BamB/ABC-type phosphate/phosphonate transport system substrate-binding protein
MSAYIKRSWLAMGVCIGLAAPAAWAATASAKSEAPLSMVVMDPLAAPLSCPCVAGYAQRKYEELGEYLGEQLGRPVVVTFSETIAGALEKLEPKGIKDVHLVIGKDSVIRAEGKKLKLGVKPLARLTGKDGKTTMTGLIVVRSGDAAQTVEDLRGYRILFGPADCDEKFAAARKMLEKAGVELAPPEKAEISEACSDGACKIIEWGDSEKAAAVISSYAAPLLEGCGTIKKGDLRVVGETRPVPFITAFATKALTADERTTLGEALVDSAGEPGMLTALETLMGFLAVEPDKTVREATSPTSLPANGAEAKPTTSEHWPGWLGPHRNGHCAWLPERLPETPQVVWRRPLGRSGLGGLAATDRYVLVGDRDAANLCDVFRCVDARTGKELWTVMYPAPGDLDYDNSPRATPLVSDGRVFFFGAFGDLTCAELATGDILWQTNVRRQFLAEDELPWGTCSSPLAVDDLVIVNPGAPEASLVAFDQETGEIAWQAPGEPQGYGSLIAATLGGVRQIVGHTSTRLCGWDVATGERLWELAPEVDGDFNVPTPVVVDGRLLVCTENNGSRLFAFDDGGRIVAKPQAVNDELAPQTSTPVAVGSRIFCVSQRLYCLDAARGLKTLWIDEETALGDFAPLVAAGERLLAVGRGGELLLIDAAAEELRIVSRLSLDGDAAERGVEHLTFPAIVGSRLYVRLDRELICLELAG